ncbi:2-oxo acid dehydrogenase subunit E2 [Spiroplasma endosymbiont of Polydrusus formosus]|uniref:2-oxo acid dehydrogenase subunit E2 n=1 Tax=Spiroplasma endosymbiont of Polydrusus formosus TaxID=3139326 RepID=UPI0035B54F22
MKKIRVLTLEKRGILKKFLNQNEEVKSGEEIALIESENGQSIITAPINGIVVKPIKEGSKIKSNTIIAYLLTTEDEIEKYYFKRLANNESTRLNKKGIKFSTTKNGQFGTKWKDIEKDDYSGISVTNEDTLHPTFTPPLLNQQQFHNNEETAIESRTTLINEQPFNNQIMPQIFKQNNEQEFLPKGIIINNDPYLSPNPDKNQSIYFKQQNNILQQDQTFKQPITTRGQNKKRWDETGLSFGFKKTRSLSFKNLNIDDNYIINNQKKIPSIDTVNNPMYQGKKRGDVKATMVNIPNLNNNMFQKSNFEAQNNSLNQPPSPSLSPQIIVTNAVPISQTKLIEENQTKEYDKYLVNTTKQQDEEPVNAAEFLGGKNQNASFRNLVNKRREQLHNNNDFHELSLEADSSKSSTDFLNEYGRPKILRNIVQGRINDLIKRNISPPETQSGGYNSGYNSNVNTLQADEKNEPSDEIYISSDGYTIDPSKEKQAKIKKTGNFSPLKSYRDRLYEKLNDNDQREKILKTKNQRELIKKRMEQIAKSNVEVDSVLGGISNYRRPSFEEIESQYEMLNNKYNSHNSEQNKVTIDAIQQGSANEQQQLSKQFKPKENNGKDNREPNPLSFQPGINDNNVMIELAILKERLANQEQNNKQNELLREIKSLRQINNSNKNSNNSDNYNGTNFDKMMQYMLMQQMLKTINEPDPILKEMLKEFKINNRQNIKKGNENNEGAHNLQVKKFNTEESITSNVHGNLVQPLNDNLSIINTNSKIESQGLETREEIKSTKYPAIKSMIMSQTHVPPLTINGDIDMSSIIDQQRKLKNANIDHGVRFSTMSFLVKAVSLSLSKYPKLNSYYDSKTNQIVIKNSQHIGLATETSEGLVIPVIKFAERMSLKQIAINIQEIIERLRQGELYDYELQGSTITIANYGMVGAVNATPTIFYPNSAVIGIGRIVRKPVVIKGDKLVIRSIMNLSLTIDQRIIDAAEAGIFLTRSKEILESPELITLS